MQPRSLNGRTVAITGGARGIGKATAKALVAKGARVAIGDLDLALAEKTATELGGNVVAFALDVTDRSSFDNFLSEAERELGPLDVLINNAGIMPVGLFTDEADDSARRQIDINVHGVIFGTKLALERMRPRGSGHIVNIASQAGKNGVPGVATYCASKHAVVGLSEAVRGELRGSGIEVSCVMPAIVNTELTSGVKPARGVRNVEPAEVADAIVGALEKPKFDIPVPRSAQSIGTFMSVFPRAVREAVARAMKVDKVMIDVDEEARRSYEDRAAHSEPSAEEKQPVS
jgi:NAD(P)-dependent dehydrogenase (short-subunit alcohol dehydrogenase family)